MRKRYLSVYKKLSVLTIILPLLIFANFTIAKDKPKDTNIVCFAAKNKWVCAPEGQQEIANQKAQKLLEQNEAQLISKNVIIKPINIPKFETQENTDIKQTSKPKTNSNSIAHSTVSQTENPYANLWAHQLIGVSTPNSAINFVKSKQLNKKDVLIIKSVRKNMEWWIILFGLYKDKQTGLENQANLPKNIKNPWLRPLKNLKVNGYIDDF